MKKIKRLILVSRPVYWVGLVSFFWWGIIFSRAQWGLLPVLGLVYFSLPASLLVFGLNDLADYDSDRENPRKGKFDGAIISSNEKNLILIIATGCLFLFITGLTLTSHYLSALMSLGVALFAYTYSVRPVRIKSVPVLDSLSNGLWVVMIFLSGYYIDTKGIFLDHPPLRLILAFFLSATALQALGTLLDYDVDRKSGDRTIGIFLGKRPTALLSFMLLFASSILAIKLNLVLVSFYTICACLSFFIFLNPGHIIISKLKGLFFLIVLIPLPALYLLVR